MKTFTAIWQAAWHELDQPIRVGLRDEFWFVNENGQKKFYTGTSKHQSPEKIEAEILSIQHASLFDVHEIDSSGLSYRIILSSGLEIVIEAEETPGKIENNFPAFETDNFIFSVVLKCR